MREFLALSTLTSASLCGLQDLSDTTLCVLMSSITKGCDLLNDVVDKVNTAYDRTASRRRGGMV